jgi:hypothetical protein
MTAQQIATFLSYLIIGLFVIALGLFLLSIQQLRRGRKGPYWRIRRQSSQRGGVMFLASIGLFAVALALAFYSGLANLAFRGVDDFFRQSRSGLVGVVVPTETPTPLVSDTPTLEPTPTATLTNTAVPTVTDVPTGTPTSTLTSTLTETPTSTLTPTITLTPTFTLTPSATFERVLNLTPPAPGIPARAGASIEIISASDMPAVPESAPQDTPVLPAGLTRIYVFIRYRSMNDGVAWSRVLYRDGLPVQGQAYIWGQGASGQSLFFFGNDEGYAPGEYEARLYLGDEEVSRFAFTIAQ